MFSIYVNVARVGKSRIDNGSEFHTLGAQTRKARLPMHVRVRVNKHWSDDLSKRGGTYDVMSSLRFAGRFLESNLYVSVQIFKFNTWLNREPVKFYKNLLGGVVPIIESKPDSKILDVLELVDVETWHIEK